MLEPVARRVRLVLEYDGTQFCGFQRQAACPSVQAALEARLSEVCGHPIQVVGAGRTDTGVHALGQVVHFDTTARIPAEGIERAVHSPPPPDMVIRHVEETSPDFHARYSALRRTYHYYLSREKPSPFWARYVTEAPLLRPDAAQRMREALSGLVGTHDFVAFCAADTAGGNTVRTVTRTEVQEREPLLRLELTANAFLHNMVRIITGAALQVGRGRLEPEAVREALETGRRPVGAATAPPGGLFLARVEYADGYPPHDARNPFGWDL